MGLPLLNVAKYDLKLPLSGEEIQYRPFLVKEEKVLLQAMEGNNEKEILKALKQILTQCIDTEGFNVNTMAMVDLEYVFLKMRAKSVGDKSTIVFVHKPGECEQKIKIEIDLNEVKVTENNNQSDTVKLTDDVQLRLKPPTVDILSKINNLSDIDLAFTMIRNCITEIYFKDELFAVKDHTLKEVDDFINSLSSAQFAKLKDFFDGLPVLKHEIEYTCPKCGVTETRTIQGVNSFFG